jgi:hypothetical protein
MAAAALVVVAVRRLQRRPEAVLASAALLYRLIGAGRVTCRR